MDNEKNKINFDEMSNNSLLFLIKQMEADHEALKIKMVKDYDNLVEIELTFDKANKLLVKRLKG